MIGVQGFPPGFICFPSGDVQRYTDFFASALFTHVPQGTYAVELDLDDGASIVLEPVHAVSPPSP